MFLLNRKLGVEWRGREWSRRGSRDELWRGHLEGHFDLKMCTSTPLIPDRTKRPDEPSPQGHEVATTNKETESLLSTKAGLHRRTEICDIFVMGISMSIAQLLVIFMNVIMVAFASQLGNAELDGIGLALSLSNVTFWSITEGLSSASETFISQAYGSPHKLMVGVFLQRSIILFVLTSLIMTAVNVNSDIILILFGQDPVLACIARRFLVVAAPGYFCFYIFRLLISYLRVQDVFWPVVLSSAFGTSSFALFAYLLVNGGYGVDGIAIAHSLSFLVMMSLVIFHIFWTKMYVATWPGWTLAMFEDCGPLVKLSVAGIALKTMEFGFLEIVTLLAGTMGDLILGAQTIVFQIYCVLYNINSGFFVACSVRVGISLGANDSGMAKRAIIITVMFMFVMVTFIAPLLISLRYEILSIFTENQLIVAIGGNTLIVLGLGMTLDGLFGVFSAALRGSGRHILASMINLICIYGIGVPVIMALHFGTDQLGLAQMWMVFYGVAAIIAAIMSCTLIKTDWMDQVQLAKERIGHRSSCSQVTDIHSDESLDLCKYNSNGNICSTNAHETSLFKTNSDAELSRINTRNLWQRLLLVSMTIAFSVVMISLSLSGFVNQALLSGKPIGVSANLTAVPDL